jgi:hypothetical protein
MGARVPEQRVFGAPLQIIGRLYYWNGFKALTIQLNRREQKKWRFGK